MPGMTETMTVPATPILTAQLKASILLEAMKRIAGGSLMPRTIALNALKAIGEKP
jgi:hypothetical protein